MMNTISLNKLRVLVALIDHQTMAKAAEVLDISAVSVHRAIHSLESELGIPLFRLEGRVLVALPYTEKFGVEVKKILSDVDHTIEDLLVVSKAVNKSLKIGALYSLTFSLLPRLISDIKMKNRYIDIELIPASNYILIKMLKEMTLDVILIAQDSPLHDLSLKKTELFVDEFVLVVPNGDKMVKKDTVCLSDLSSCNQVLLADGFISSKLVKNAFEKANLTIHVAMEVHDIFTALSMVRAGVGYALLPSRVETILGPSLEYIPLSKKDSIQQTVTLVSLACREGDSKIEIVENACQFFIEV